MGLNIMKNMVKFDYIMAVVTVFAGIAAFAAGEWVLGVMSGSYVFAMALYFCVAVVIISTLTCLGAFKLSPIRMELPYGKFFGKALGSVLIFSFLLSLGAGALFQFLYGLGDDIHTEPTDNYIIVIDNSGSMQVNDPTFERYSALKELFLLMQPHQTIGVYVFTDTFAEVFPSQNITPESIDQFDETFGPYMVSGGGTDLMRPLADIARKQLAYPLPGKTAVIVISDGECLVDNDVLRQCVDAGLIVHTVGVSHVNLQSLTRIARATGGVYQSVSEISELVDVLQGMPNFQFARMLVGYRGGPLAFSGFYAFLRVLFLFSLGLIVRVIQFFIIDMDQRRVSRLVQGAIFVLIGSVLVEVMIQNFGISEPIIRLIMNLLFAVVFLRSSVMIHGNNGFVSDADTLHYTDSNSFEEESDLAIRR